MINKVKAIENKAMKAYFLSLLWKIKVEHLDIKWNYIYIYIEEDFNLGNLLSMYKINPN